MAFEADVDRGGRKSGLVAVLLTDMVNSTQTRERLGDAYNQLLTTHDSLIEAVLSDHAPLSFSDTGDGFEATFGSARVALDAACAIQWSVQDHNRQTSRDRQLSVRVALAAGEVEWLGGKGSGMAYNQASRIEGSVAAGGEIWSTEVFRLLLGDASAHHFSDRQETDLRGISESTTLWSIDWQSVPPLPPESPMPASMAVNSRPIVGRAEDMATLQRSWLDTEIKSPAVVIVEGEPGIGKSTLVREHARQLVDEGWILYGRCQAKSMSPFGPIAQALVEFATETAGGKQFLTKQASRLMRIAPQLERWYPDLAEMRPSSDIGGIRFQVFEAVTEWLENLAAQRPVLFVIDDLHLADEPTLALLDHLNRTRSPERLLIAATARLSEIDHGQDYRGSDLSRAELGSIKRLMLRGLTLDEVRELAAVRLNRRQASLSLAGQLRDQTGGNPLFLQGILDELEADGMDRYESTSSVQPGRVGSVPDDASELFNGRYHGLSGNARDIADVASLMGETFAIDIVQSALTLDVGELDAALEELVGAGLVLEVGGEWEFSHAVIRRAAEQNVERKVDLHVAIANAIRATDGAEEHAAELSRHYAESSDPELILSAADYAVIAAEQAMAALAPMQAATMYRFAIEHFDRLPGGLKDEARCEYTAKLGNAMKAAAQPGYDAVLLEAAQIARRLGDTSKLAEAALATCTGFWAITGAVDEAKLEVLQAALDAVGESDPATRALLMAGMATELNFSREPRRRKELISAAEDLAQELDAQHPSVGTKMLLAAVLEARCSVLMNADGLDERIALHERLDALGTELRPTRMFPAASYGCWTALEAGRIDAAQLRLRQMAAITEGNRKPGQRAVYLHWQSSVAMTLGDIDHAVSLAEQSYDMHRSIGTADAMVFRVGLLYMERWMRGTLSTLIQDLRECSTETARVGMRSGLAFAQCVSGDPDAAIKTIESIDLRLFQDPVAHQDQVSSLVHLAATVHELGDIYRINQTYDMLERHRDQFVFNGTASLGSTHHYLGMLASDLERYDVAEAHFVEASKKHKLLRAPCLVAETNLQWAALLKKRWQPKDSVRFTSMLDSALSVAHERGLTDLEHRCQIVGA